MPGTMGGVDRVDDSRHVEEDLTDAERNAGKSAFDVDEEETQDFDFPAQDGSFANELSTILTRCRPLFK